MPPTLTGVGLIELLEELRRTFTDEPRPLLMEQRAKLRTSHEMLLKDKTTLHQKLRKAYTILTGIKKNVGNEVYLLCALSTTSSRLGNSKLGDYISSISTWWASVGHPKGLRFIATSEIPSAIIKYDCNESDEFTIQSAEMRTRLTESRSPLDNPVQLQHLPEYYDLPSSYNQPPSHNRTPVFERPPDQPAESIQFYLFGDLLDFLQEYRARCSTVKMICPWYGEPLPSITCALGPDLQVKMELSIQTSQIFMKYAASRPA